MDAPLDERERESRGKWSPGAPLANAEAEAAAAAASNSSRPESLVARHAVNWSQSAIHDRGWLSAAAALLSLSLSCACECACVLRGGKLTKLNWLVFTFVLVFVPSLCACMRANTFILVGLCLQGAQLAAAG